MAADFMGILTPILDAVEILRPSQGQVNEVYPEFTPGTVMRDDSLAEWPRLVIVRGTDPPPTGFGETAREVAPVPSGGVWRQTWVVDRITVDDAKTQTAQLALDIYWSKMMLTPPTPQEAVANQADPDQILVARMARFRPKLNEVRTRIAAISDSSPTGVQDAYAIYRELEVIA